VPPRERLAAVLGGLAAGAAGGLFGVGGGIVLVPILVGAFRLTQHQAHGTSLATIGAAALAALAIYGAYSHVEWRTAAIVALGSLVSARYGARLAHRTSPTALRRAFAILLVVAGVRLLWRTPSGGSPLTLGLAPTLAIELALGVAVGVLAGYMGVGGGILAVPAFTLLLGMPQQVAQGTSLAVILVSAPASTFEHSKHGNVVWRLVPMLAIGAAIGAPLSSWLAQLLPRERLTQAFAVFMLMNAVHIWIKTRQQPAASPASRPA
jgi:uncharacterized membrane protein YfcA